MQYWYDHLCKRANGHPTTERYVFIRKTILTVTALCATFGTALGLQALGTPTAQAMVSGSGNSMDCPNISVTGGAEGTCEQRFVTEVSLYGLSPYYEGTDANLIDTGYMVCQGWSEGATTPLIYQTLQDQGWDENEANALIYYGHVFLCPHTQAH